METRVQTKKTAVLETVDTLLSKAKVTKKLRGNIINRVANGLDSREGEFVDSEFVYELIYAFKVLMQHGLSHYGKRPGRKFKPVDIETFVCGSLYMDQKEYVRPAILYHLKRLFSEEFEHCYEVLESGAIGYGKNYFADMAQAYILYNLSSFYSPQVEFGLAPGSDIIMMQQSVTTKLAKKVVFGQFGARLALSPYFTNHFPFDKRVRTELRFPENITIMPISSSSTAALSMNIYGGCFPATQTFVTDSGLCLLSSADYVPDCLTIDKDFHTYPVSVKTVCTGFKPFVKLHLDNGEHIICTPDQKFKTIGGNWKQAEDAARCVFVFVKGSWTQEVRCDRVENTISSALAYDIENVPETHAFLTPTSRGGGALIAHNCIDELSFMQKVKKSKRSEGGDLGYDQAEKLYNVVLRRMESRAIILGRIPGKLFLLGSANYVGDFIDRKLAEVKLLKEQGKVCPIYSMHMAQWEAYPEGTFCGEKFKVILPSEKTGGAVVTEGEEIDEDAEVKEIPIEYQSKFERDFEGSLKDIAGIPIGRLGRFIRDIRKVYICAEKHGELFEGRQLFTTDEISQRQWHNIDDIIDFEYINKYIDKDTRLGGHIDLAITGDCCGIGIGHVLGFVKLKDSAPTREGASDLGVLPIIVIDGTLSILPPIGGEIDLFMVRDLILRIGELTNLVFANLDSYESAMMIQSFRQNRISSHVLSVDRTPEPYKDTKDSALGGRLLIPNSPKLIKEIKTLGFDRAANKVDHMEGSSKDMADCVAGVVSVFSHLRSSFRGVGTGRPSVTMRPSGTALPAPKTTGRRIQLGELV